MRNRFSACESWSICQTVPPGGCGARLWPLAQMGMRCPNPAASTKFLLAAGTYGLHTNSKLEKNNVIRKLSVWPSLLNWVPSQALGR